MLLGHTHGGPRDKIAAFSSETLISDGAFVAGLTEEGAAAGGGFDGGGDADAAEVEDAERDAEDSSVDRGCSGILSSALIILRHGGRVCAG